MEVIVALLKHEPLLMIYLRDCGMGENDLRSMVEQTLRGGDVARHLYHGMVTGLTEGVRMLNTADQSAVEALSGWLGDEDA